MRKILFVISVILFILFFRLAIKGVGNVDINSIRFGDTVDRIAAPQSESSFRTPEEMLGSSHVHFQGIPLNGTLNDVMENLEAKGYELIEEHANVARLNGRLFRFEHTDVYVESCPVCLEVFRVTVCLPQQNSWTELRKQYFNCKEQMTEKFGKPVTSYERFKQRLSIEDDAACEAAIKNGNCFYETVFKIKGGHVTLGIHSTREFKQEDGFIVAVCFIDTQNDEDREQCVGA